MAPTAFRRPPQAPLVFTATPESIKRDTQALIDQARNAIDELVKEFDPATSSKNPTFENVMVPQLDHENQMSLSNRILGFYSSVATDAKLRDVSSESEQLMEEYSIEISMRDDMFQIVKAVYEKEKENRTIDDVDFRILEKDYKAYLRMGLGLPPGPKRDRFKEIKLRLSEIQIQFQKNLNEESNALWFTREELDGFPEDLLETLKVGTEEDGAENVGKHRLTFKYPELFPALKYIKNSETRRKVFVANEKKIPENIALFKEAITLRSEGSRLLGFPNHAVFRLEDKMAKTPEHVNAFLGDLHKRLTPGAKAELAKLKQLKSEDLKSRGLESQDDGHYYLWDHRFYDRLLVEKEYSIDHQTISEYFPIQTTIRGMLEIFEQLFGLQFIELKTKEERDAVAESGNGEDIVWHEDVQLFSVWNDGGEGGEFVGYLYLDLFPRVGKYSHAANFNLQPGFIDVKTGKRHYPATALVCNFSKPTAKKPSLLKHEEVTTLFHELGHGIHDLVAKTKYSRYHGTDVVRDFVEAPSQMLENWCWTPSQLRSLSHHYSHLSEEYAKEWAKNQTGDDNNVSLPPLHIPDDLIQKLIATKNVNGALFNLRQLHFGMFDMAVHQGKTHEEIVKMNPSAVYNALRRDITLLDGMDVFNGSSDDWADGQATFGHLVGGYDVGYYGYLYSQVYSTDMFYTAFKANPMDGATGRRYRYTILGRGGSRDEMEGLREFLGREPNGEAFYKDLGIE
ncbi:metallopeptidase MepB [Ascosphaera apis ARSEF 7405]|uniref:Metallopeptidase MepB n=1 Tax=Ascosphaera apis ARSEF 7405 TaxID=392613 RepID=A0A167VSP5_9EURO|nr:metallopeptidase MepB [Ascosphaera apis ARSEF 7405]